MPDPDHRIARHAEMLHNRVRKRFRHLRKWARRDGVTCYRTYDRDIPEIPLALDVYEDALHMAEFRRRDGDREPAIDDAWLDAMARAAADAIGISPDAVWIKRHARQRGDSQYGPHDRASPPREVAEGGLRFEVNLGGYLDTGLFLDHRITRDMVRRDAAGARVLNLFCYTGSFSVYAAAGGARETVSVDLSRTYLDWTWRNLTLNRLDVPSNRLIHDDARELVRDWIHTRDEPPFDVAVVDPPTFSNSKRMQGVFDVARDHASLINDVLAVLRPGGVLYFSTNRRKFTLDASAVRASDIEDITAATCPPDFSRRPHRAWRIRR